MADKNSLSQTRDEEVENANRSDMQQMYSGLKQLEDQSVATGDASIESDGEHKTKTDTEERYTRQLRRGAKSSTLFVCTLFIVAIVGLFFVSPMILLINNKEQLVNDLNDGFLAYHTYTDKVLGMQLAGGCGQESIDCKFKTMSAMLKERFERYGYTVAATENKQTGRYSVASLQLPNNLGSPRDARSLSELRKNYSANDMLDRVYSSRVGVFHDQKFYHRLWYRFGLRQGNQLQNINTAEKFAKDFDERVKIGDPRYVGSGVGDNDDSIDANGRGTYSLGSLADMNEEWLVNIPLNLTEKANTHLSLACAYATYGQLAENSLKKAYTTTVARFAMNYLSLADDIKSNNGVDNSRASETLASRLMTRDKNGNTAMDADSYTVPAMGTKPEDVSAIAISSLDRFLGMLRLGGSPALPSSDWLKAALIGIVPSAATDRTPRGMCAEGMAGKQISQEQSGRCWAPASVPLANHISTVAGSAVAGMKEPIEKTCSGSVKAVVELVANASRTPVAAAIWTSRLSNAARMAAAEYTSTRSGVDAQNTIFAGAGIILGDRAQSLGMRPASAKTFAEYTKLAYEQQQSQADSRRQLARATPWDATNPYTFFGQIVQKIAPMGTQLGSSLSANASALFSTLPKSFATVLGHSANAVSTQPVHFDVSRLRPASKCNIGSLGEFDEYITPDMACNIRYSMSTAELNADLNAVIAYMTKAHPENAKTITRDTGADPDNGGRMQKQANEGRSKPYIDQKTGKPNKYTEYAKFLEYCVDRHDPWGSTGMVVEPADTTLADNEDWGEDTSFMSAMIREEKPDATKTPDSYFALGWGAPEDQDWYTGKRCVDESGTYAEMLKNFRAYTMACNILAGMSGSINCWDDDRKLQSHDDFFLTNNIIFRSLED